MVAPGAPPLSVMPQREADTVPVLCGVAKRGGDGARTDVHEQTLLQK